MGTIYSRTLRQNLLPSLPSLPLQDLIKYTCSDHPDRVTLQMALAKYEGIANFLNESKRQQEQKMVVQNLTHKVSHLPFRLTDGKRWLHRQDIVTRIVSG